MDIPELIRGVGESVGGGASVKNVYGEPVTSGQRTVIPVAKFMYSFGAGGGSGTKQGQPESSRGGGGGGGAAKGRPCGVVEITPEGTRFIYYHESTRLALALAAGFLLGALWARK